MHEAGNVFLFKGFIQVVGPEFVTTMTERQLFKRALATSDAKSKLKYCLHTHVKVLYAHAYTVYTVFSSLTIGN